MGGTWGVPEAPVDGKLYGRKDEGWEEVPEAEGFDISGLPVAATLLNSDYLPVSQSAAPSVRFWRLTVLSNTENNTYGLTNRLYEMQLREIVGIPQTAEPATVTGTRWYSNYPVGNAVDGDTSTRSEERRVGKGCLLWQAPWDRIGRAAQGEGEECESV